MADFLPYGKPQLFNDDGSMLSNGTVYFYTHTTSNLTNTITLDAQGRAGFWTANGLQKIRVLDSINNVIYTQDDVVGISTAGSIQSQSIIYAGTTGSANAYTVTLNPVLTYYQTGLVLRLRIHAANTGASTLNVDGLGLRNIRKNSRALTGSELNQNQIYTFVYDGVYFHLVDFDYYLISPRGVLLVSVNGQVQALSNGVTTALSHINSEVFDSDSYWVSTDPTNITIPAIGSSNVIVSFYGRVARSAGWMNNARYVLSKNGTSIFSRRVRSENTAAQDTVDTSFEVGPIPVASSDKLQMGIYVEFTSASCTHQVGAFSVYPWRG